MGEASQLLAKSVHAGQVPAQGISVLLKLSQSFAAHGADDLAESMRAYMCPLCERDPPHSSTCGTCKDERKITCVKCSGSGRFAPTCRSCDGLGLVHGRRSCHSCNGSGRKDLGSCNECQGAKASP